MDMQMEPTTELLIHTFIQELKLNRPNLEEFIYLAERLEEIIKAYIRENLESCSDIKYNVQLAKSIIAVEDFNDLLHAPNEYVIRKHIRSIIRIYISEVSKSRQINIS